MFVSYDLSQPERNYEKVAKAIKECGHWAKVQKSFWYVRANMTMADVFAQIRKALDSDDKLIVVDVTNNNATWTPNHDPKVIELIRASWHIAVVPV